MQFCHQSSYLVTPKSLPPAMSLSLATWIPTELHTLPTMMYHHSILKLQVCSNHIMHTHLCTTIWVTFWDFYNELA